MDVNGRHAGVDVHQWWMDINDVDQWWLMEING
jgi:hypothetical protein